MVKDDKSTNNTVMSSMKQNYFTHASPWVPDSIASHNSVWHCSDARLALSSSFRCRIARQLVLACPALVLSSTLHVLVLRTESSFFYVRWYSRPHHGDNNPIFVVACDEPF